MHLEVIALPFLSSEDHCVLIGVLGNSDSWYLHELQRAGGELGHEVVRLEFPRIVASCGMKTGAA